MHALLWLALCIPPPIGGPTCSASIAAAQADPNAHPSEDDVGDDDNLFEPKRRDTGSGADASNLTALDAADSSRVPLDDSLLAKWGDPGRTEQLRNRFVTGESWLLMQTVGLHA